MRNFILTLAITFCACIGVYQLYLLTLKLTQTQNTIVVREPAQRYVPIFSNHNFNLPPSNLAHSSVPHRSSTRSHYTPPRAGATIKYNFTQPLQSTNFGNSGFSGGSSGNISSYGRKNSPTNNSIVNFSGSFSGVSLRRSNETKTTTTTETQETDNELLAMTAPFGPMMAPPTVGGDFDGYLPDIGMEDAVDDGGLDIESEGVPVGSATCLLPFIALYGLFIKRKTRKTSNAQ